MGAFLLLTVGLVGCQDNTKHAKKIEQHVVSPTTKNGRIKIIGQNFAGSYQGAGTKTDPSYEYLMAFKADGTFRQDITATDGYYAKFVEQGTYTIDKQTAKIVINIQQVVEVTYATEYDLSHQQPPISYDYRKQQGGKALTAAEDKPINILIKSNYLQGSVNGVQLRPTKHAMISFNHFKTAAQNEVQSQKSRKTTTSTSRQTTNTTKVETAPTGSSELTQLKAEVAGQDPSLKVTSESVIDTNMGVELYNLLVGKRMNVMWRVWRNSGVDDDAVITLESDGSYKLFFQGTATPAIRRFGDVAVYGFIREGLGANPTDYEKEIVDLKNMRVIGTTTIAPTHIHDQGGAS